MKLTQFEQMVEEIKSDSTLNLIAKSINVFRKFDDKWFDEASINITDVKLISKLDRCLSKKCLVTEDKGKEVLVCVKEVASVVLAKFVSCPRSQKRTLIEQQIYKCYRHSANAYKATHDSLTGLLNKQAFQERVESISTRMQHKSFSGGEFLKESSSGPFLHILAFDIDNFKQVNDNYGHLYGDVILRVFAKRIEQEAKKIKEMYTDFDILVARPGGEEFNIALCGVITEREALDISERMRSAVAEQPFPKEDEWEDCAGKGMTHGIDMPHLAERKITTSIGIVTHSGIIKESNAKYTINKLLNQADISLYRAKAGGKDRVISFGQILNNCGRVIEHHTDTDIITIDMGKHVSVNVGQEFIIYHPDFTGTTNYIYNDGRTRKKLGTYPKYSAGMIEVFEVQNEISFCKIVKNNLNGSMPVGAVLEAVPMGSITHLISEKIGDKTLLEKDIDAGKLQSEVDKLIENGQEAIAVVFSIIDLDTITKDRGVGFVKQCLVNLFVGAKESFPKLSVVGQIPPKNIAVVCTGMTKEDIEMTVKKVIEYSEIKCSMLVKFSAGIYYNEYASKELDGNQSTLNENAALDFARFAASDKIVSESSPIEFFTPHTTYRILQAWAHSNDYQQGLADYREFTSLGVKYSGLENRLANLAFINTDYETAMEHSLNALELLDIPIYHANIGIVGYCLGNKLLSYEHFIMCLREDLPEEYAMYYALSLYDYYKHCDDIDIVMVKDALKDAVKAKTRLDPLSIGISTVKHYLAEITKITRAHTEGEGGRS